MKPPTVLLAKSLGSLPRPEEARLVTHTVRAGEAARIILEVLVPILQPLVPAWSRLQRLVIAACLFHDFGKANSAFQAMVEQYPKATDRQPIRHEILSFLLMMEERYLGGWLQNVLGSETDKIIAACSAGGHHPKLNGGAEGMVRADGIGVNTTLHFFGAHKDTTALLRTAAKSLTTPNHVPSLEDFILSFIEDSEEGYPTEWLDEIVARAKSSLRQLGQDDRRLLAFTKALTIAADVAGSALAVEKNSPCRWIPEALGRRLQSSHLHKIIRKKLQEKTAFRFQEKVEASKKPVTAVVAGCGNGKTLAAYMWARRHAVGRKLFFCYPTTGTASAGYEDYLHAQTNLERALIHGRFHIDLEAMASTPDDDASEENQRLESLRAWSQRAIVCTADTKSFCLEDV